MNCSYSADQNGKCGLSCLLQYKLVTVVSCSCIGSEYVSSLAWVKGLYANEMKVRLLKGIVKLSNGLAKIQNFRYLEINI